MTDAERSTLAALRGLFATDKSLAAALAGILDASEDIAPVIFMGLVRRAAGEARYVDAPEVWPPFVSAPLPPQPIRLDERRRRAA